MAARAMTKSPTNRIAQFAFGSAIAILLVVGGLSYRSIVASRESNGWVQHTHEVLDNLQELQLAMETLTSNVRGYVLTADESYLDRYRAARLSLGRYETAVRDLTVDNPEQQRRIPALERLSAERLELADQNINLRRDLGSAAAERWTQAGPGLQIMVKYQAIVRQMQ